ncbi:triose-phosphate isomerase [Flammeovirga kamogawensis]|uniref:Triosephosphate isomerase n=1 Tax=Flammeovirga kamogawensis TaxID=373891 RepID=A0ABX8GR15_9BACT|nr:triose-phosphate isomerase [Flammeovirga kamogawensis]MBB6462754.1 triosephosphate isomerase [Flammeovirga kamogawensis]QWG06015.1 triose-phosphate isomerase [Flammeovirga kamogawensis]TRX67846.1 triose-phosphate isomerase [Flammeovirga kamogawensis]
MRQKIVAGNWKMNLLKEEAESLASEVVNMAKDETPSDVKVIMCTPFVHLSKVKSLIGNSANVFVGAQNCYTEPKGAFTGEISAPQLASYGIDYVILGHSERREYFGESNEMLATKTDAVLANNMLPIFCFGEVLEEREAGTQKAVVEKQLSEGLFHLSAEDFGKVVLAYEPVWAIGTGKTASSAQAQEMHKDIRDMVAAKYGQEVADATPILYGGSAKPSNAQELFAQPDVDGGLIGGASLASRDFIDISKSY